MSLADFSSFPDLLGAVIGFSLTLMVFSYIIGDNIFFRVAIYVFIGVAAGYAAVVVWYSVIWPQLLEPLLRGSRNERLFIIFPLVMGVLLLFKLSPRLTRVGNPTIAYLIGVGVAVAIGGAVIGTVFPLVIATIQLFDFNAIPSGESWFTHLVKAAMILLGTITTLLYFHFGVRSKSEPDRDKPRWAVILSWIGQIFIGTSLGVIFAGVFSASLTAMIERITFLVNFVLAIIGIG